MSVLSDEDVEARIEQLGDGWEKYGNSLRREFKFGDFSGAVDFVNRLTPAAQEMNHHPDLEISWDTVTVRISTHSEGGLTENDFELAARIDSLA